VLSVLARTLWIQGFPSQAMNLARDCVARAVQTDSAASLCFALGHAACPVAIWSGNAQATDDWLAMLAREAARHHLGGWLLWVRVLECALGRRDRASLGAPLGLTHAAMIGTIDPWLVELDTFARAEAGSIGWCTPEILRARAVQVLRKRDSASQQTGAQLLTRALEISTAHGALSWQLRAATSLASLRRDQGRGADARAILEVAYGRFTEGFETADLVAARELLAELGARSQRADIA